MLKNIKSDFPLFKNQPDLVYLDSAATALKPESVLQAMDEYYREYSTNVARGLYPLAEKATAVVEQTRKKAALFIGAEAEGTVFVANATAAINLVATGLREKVTQEHNIVVTALEHHSNYLPWKELSYVTGAELRIAYPNKEGVITPESLKDLVDEHTLILALSAVSNVLGLINPVQKITEELKAKNPNLLVLVDACQAVGHIPVSLKEWGVDFLVFSGHKILGPTGIGVLAGTKESLTLLAPVNRGGGTVLDPLVTPTLYKELPFCLEGGTPNIAGIIGLGAAIDYIEKLSLPSIREHDVSLTTFTLSQLKETFGEKVTILGSLDPEKRAGLVSFTLDSVHPHDIAHILGEENICVRAGEHCARMLHNTLNISASTRLSFSVYSDEKDIERCMVALKKAEQLFV